LDLNPTDFIQLHFLVTGIDNVITYHNCKLSIWRV